MSTNIDVLNYLNMTNPRLGKLFKTTGYNPLPDDFVLTKNLIKERLTLGQINCIQYPDFVFEEKKNLKKYFKNSLKNIKNILKNASIEGIDEKFVKKMDFYFNVRREITLMLLKDFKKVDFDECEAYCELFALNPVFSELLPDIFEPKFDISLISPEFEKKYEKLYKEKQKEIKEKMQKENAKQQHENIVNLQKTAKNTAKMSKTKKTKSEKPHQEKKITKTKQDKEKL